MYFAKARKHVSEYVIKLGLASSRTGQFDAKKKEKNKLGNR